MSLIDDSRTKTANSHLFEERPTTLVEQLQLENQQLRAQLDDLADAWESVRAEVSDECATRERLSASLQEARAEAEAERRGRQAAERRAEAAETEVLKAATASATATERCELALRERAELRTGVAELKAKLDATVRDMEKLRSENASLREQLLAQPALPQTQQSISERSVEYKEAEVDQRWQQGAQIQTKVAVESCAFSALKLTAGSNRSTRTQSSSSDRLRNGHHLHQSSKRRASAAVNSDDDLASLLGGSAMLVRLHRLERENSALRQRLGIPHDSSLPASVYNGRMSRPDRRSERPTNVVQPPVHSADIKRLDVEQWTARHAHLQRLLGQRLGHA